MAPSPRKTPLGNKGKPSPSNQRRRTAQPKAKRSTVTNPLPSNPSSFMGEQSSFGFDEAGLHVPTGNSEILLTRRQLLYGAAGLAALGAAGAGFKAFNDYQSQKDAIYTLEVAENAVISLDDCELAEASDMVSAIASVDMPYGTLIWASTDSVAACLIPTEQSKPIATIGILSVTAGTYTEVIDKAMQQDEGYEIYDVRMSENGIIWTESNILQGAWSVWAAPVVGLDVGEPVKVADGDSDWELPSLAAVGSHAFWQLRPSLSGNATAEESKVKTALFTKLSSISDVITSNGRFATHLYPTDEGIVVTPRHPRSSSNYQLVHLSARTGEELDSITLPSLMTPLEAGYGPYGFTFSFESIYNYGGGIANLGTYTPIVSHETGDYDNLSWFRFGRTPSVAPCWSKNSFVVKSTTAVAVIDPEAKTYCTLDLDNDMESYGDVLCSYGRREAFVTAMNVDDTATVEASGGTGKVTRKCIVRTWSALA